MRTGFTHAKAVGHTGPVCGADDGTVTQVTDDPNLVDCPDCSSLAQIQALPDDAAAGDPRTIELLREVVRGQFRKIDGVVVDTTMANTILTVYDALKPANRAKLAALRVDRMAEAAWRLLRLPR